MANTLITRLKHLSEVCPIEGRTTDANVARTIAAQVIALTAAALSCKPVSLLALAILLYDFTARIIEPKFSILAHIGKFINKTLKITPKPVDLASKRFAARLGLVFVTGILIGKTLLVPIIAYVFGFTLILAASLEAFLGICMGCVIYNVVRNPLDS